MDEADTRDIIVDRIRAPLRRMTHEEHAGWLLAQSAKVADLAVTCIDFYSLHLVDGTMDVCAALQFGALEALWRAERTKLQTPPWVER